MTTPARSRVYRPTSAGFVTAIVNGPASMPAVRAGGAVTDTVGTTMATAAVSLALVAPVGERSVVAIVNVPLGAAAETDAVNVKVSTRLPPVSAKVKEPLSELPPAVSGTAWVAPASFVTDRVSSPASRPAKPEMATPTVEPGQAVTTPVKPTDSLPLAIEAGSSTTTLPATCTVSVSLAMIESSAVLG